jgi:IS5 family transposase
MSPRLLLQNQRGCSKSFDDGHFRVIKRQFSHMKTRYRGLAKNRAHLFTLFALGNLFLVRRRLLA